jgi:cell division septal protein FtsQ
MDNKIPTISYAAHEGMMARMERTIRRLWILCIILILLLAGTNAAWLWYEMQFEDVVTTNEITQDVNSDGGGDAIVNDGVHINGQSTANGENND